MDLGFFGGDSEDLANVVLEPESALSKSESLDWPPTFPVEFDTNSDDAREPEPEEPELEEPEPEVSEELVLDIILLRICYLFVSNKYV